MIGKTERTLKRRNGARPRRTGRLVHFRFAGVQLGAAMEPVHGGRDDLSDDSRCGKQAVAAMEPVHGGRDDVGTHTQGTEPTEGRNGARPRRTGRPPTP